MHFRDRNCDACGDCGNSRNKHARMVGDPSDNAHRRLCFQYLRLREFWVLTCDDAFIGRLALFIDIKTFFARTLPRNSPETGNGQSRYTDPA